MKPKTTFLTRLKGGLLSRTASLLSLALFAPAAANAATIYSETTSGVGTTSVNDLGWTGYLETGTNLSTSTSDPLLVTTFIGFSSGTTTANSRGLDIVAITDAGTINLADYQNDIVIAFNQSKADNTTTPQNQWRVVLTLSGITYASNSFLGTETRTDISAALSSNIWRVWANTGTNLTDGFNVSDISGTTTSLTSGSISNIGILYEETAYTGENDRGRLFSMTITGTEAIPEPSTALLGSLGLLALLRRRRA